MQRNRGLRLKPGEAPLLARIGCRHYWGNSTFSGPVTKIQNVPNSVKSRRGNNLSRNPLNSNQPVPWREVLPFMQLDTALSNDRQLVYTPGPAKAGSGNCHSGSPPGPHHAWPPLHLWRHGCCGKWPDHPAFPVSHWLPLLLGAGLTLLAPLIGLGICSSSQLVLDKDAGQLTRSWRWLGLSGSSRSPLGEPVSVGWTRKQETTQSSGSSPPTTKTTYPVRLRTEGVRPIPDLFTPETWMRPGPHPRDWRFFEIPEHHWDEQVKDPSSEVARQLVQKQAAENAHGQARRSGTGGRSTD